MVSDEKLGFMRVSRFAVLAGVSCRRGVSAPFRHRGHGRGANWQPSFARLRSFNRHPGAEGMILLHPVFVGDAADIDALLRVVFARESRAVAVA